MSNHRLGHGLAARGFLASALLAALCGLNAAAPAVGAGDAAELHVATDASVTITVRLRDAWTGTFRMTGAASDRGQVRATRTTVVRGMLRMTQRLTGASGALVISSSHACATGKGKWKVVSGTGAYRDAHGGGSTRGRTGCMRTRTSTVTYTGSIVVPPPPLAVSGLYGGWTPQNEWFQFEVDASGRNVQNVLVGSYKYECVTDEDGYRQPMGASWDLKAAGPFPIAEDRSFVAQVLQPTTISGRFTDAGAEGTIVVRHTFTDPWRRPSTCAGDIPWTVTNPPPPPRRALVGRYCGSTRANQGVCLDVPEGGREFRNLRVGARLLCGEFAVLVDVTTEGTFSMRENLSFRHSFSGTILGGEPGPVSVEGSFDQAGQGTGRLTLGRRSFTFEGKQYTCTGGGASWTVKLQR